MRIYKVVVTCKDYFNPNEIDHYTQHSKYVSEDTFNKIYELLTSND